MADVIPGGRYLASDGKTVVDAHGNKITPSAPEPSVSEYEAMDKADLETLAKERGLAPTGSGKDGGVLKADLVAALAATPAA